MTEFVPFNREPGNDFDSESQLEKFVISNPEILEEGLRIIFHQRKTRNAGIPEIVGVGADNNLVIIELKNEEADCGALGQLFRYLNWALKNGPVIEKYGRNLFKKEKFQLLSRKPPSGEILLMVLPE